MKNGKVKKNNFIEYGENNARLPEAFKIFPKSNDYRDSLIPFIGTQVSFVCTKWKTYEHAKKYDLIVCEHVNPHWKNKELDKKYKTLGNKDIDHLWLRVDKDWIKNNNIKGEFQNNKTLIVKGIIHEYVTKTGFLNIGVQANILSVHLEKEA